MQQFNKIKEENQIEIYQANDGSTQINVQFEREKFWITQQQIADLFGTRRPAITKHIGNIFKSGELDEKVVSSILEHTTQHGAIKGKKQKVNVKHYNLDVVLSVGYRVNSVRATQFRIWANNVLKDYLDKGYAINEKRLVQKEQEINLLKKPQRGNILIDYNSKPNLSSIGAV